MGHHWSLRSRLQKFYSQHESMVAARQAAKWSAPTGIFPSRGCRWFAPTTKTSRQETCIRQERPVSRIMLWARSICMERPSCGHSSRRRVAADVHQRPTRRFRQWLEPPERIGQMRNANLALSRCFPPYLVLLRVGFTLPRPLQDGRCALTAPFHPYPGAGVCATTSVRGKPGKLGYCGSRVALPKEG